MSINCSNSPLKPDWIKVQITRNCNLSCSFCSQAEWRENVNLDISRLIENVLLPAMPLRLLIITGGEPLTKIPELTELLSFCQSNKIEVGIFTNLTLLDQALACKLKVLGVQWLRTTINGSIQNVHECSYPKGSFLKTLEGISVAQRNNLHVKVRVTVSRSNLNDVENILRLCAEKSIEEVDFRPYLPLGDCNPHEDFNLHVEEMMRICALLMLYREHKPLVKIKLLPGWFDYIFENLIASKTSFEECHCGRKYLYVDAEGNYRSCAGHKYIIDSMTNVKIDSVWIDNPHLTAVRSYSQPDYCAKCPCRVNCHKANCHLVNYETSQSFESINPYCPIYYFDPKDSGNGYIKAREKFSIYLAEAKTRVCQG